MNWVRELEQPVSSLVIPAKVGIQLVLPLPRPPSGERVGVRGRDFRTLLLIRSVVASSESFRCPAASGQLFGKRQKVAKKRSFFSQGTLSAESTSLMLAADRALPARDHPRSAT